MIVKSLHYYPVKSCAGVDLDSALISDRGILNDRIFMLVDEDNVFMSQRKNPKMALIKPWLSGQTLTLAAPGMNDISLNFLDYGAGLDVTVWKDRCQAIDQGWEVSDWLSNFLGTSTRLVMLPKTFKRKLDPDYALTEKNQTGFADGFPFLLISQESLDDLNKRLKKTVPMNRFRPNIVVGGCTAFDEDSWQKIKIGAVVFEVVKPCVRCVITTVNQQTLEISKEPLATLAKYRVSPHGGVMFGQNMIHYNNGHINVGNLVDILE
jgi:MOSC domain-containing protein